MSLPTSTVEYKPGSKATRIAHWAHTGELIFGTGEDEADGAQAVRTKDVFEKHIARTKRSSIERDPEPISKKFLTACPEKDDPLIPTTDQINHTYLRAEKTWRAYVAAADPLPQGAMPRQCFEPYGMLQNVPALPQDLYGMMSITGRSLWDIPSPEFPEAGGDSKGGSDETWNPRHTYGREKKFFLTQQSPVMCEISPRDDFRHCVSGRETISESSSNGVAILTLCWSYIFSARILEMQGRRMHYSPTIMASMKSPVIDYGAKDVIVFLGNAPNPLIRWFLAVLAPGQGWFAQGPSPPWAAHNGGDIRFIIAASSYPVGDPEGHRPPSSDEAVDLLLEFCKLYSFEKQPIGAFTAAMALPLHNYQNLKPHLPMPVLRRGSTPPGMVQRIQSLAKTLPYFMTLSVSSHSIASAVWSIFWEPGVQSNLASAWLGGTLEAILPILDSCDTEKLAKVFALRRPQLAPLWLGIFLCGCPQMSDMIKSYLETLEEYRGYGSCGPPDFDVAAWTGTPQSFLDENSSGVYTSLDALVARADVLRHRFNFRIGDDLLYVRSGWEPPGLMPKKDIEPELWPRLESKPKPREYIHWMWVLAPDVSIIERGWQVDHARIPRPPPQGENLDLAASPIVVPPDFQCRVRLQPSRDATWYAFSLGSVTAFGDHSLDAMGVPRARHHSWFAHAN